jgi:uncharacterized protein
MKKTIIKLVCFIILISISSLTFAAGGGPPKNMIKGTVLSVDATKKEATFQRDDTKEEIVLKLGDTVETSDIPLNKKVMVRLDSNSEIPIAQDISIMFMDMTLTKIISLLIIGLIGGLLSGFIGSGGAFVLTPAMMSLGAPGAVAVASNMCHKFPKAMVGAYKRYKYGQVDIKLGLVMAATAIIGVQIGIKIQKFILDNWGNAGSNLYVSVVFVIVLIFVGGYVLKDALGLSKGGDQGEQIAPLALKMQRINIPPMIHFKVANVTISAWITVPVGLLTGMLAATIAVGGFIGVPGMIYLVGASAVVASATELVVAFVMGFWGSIQWGLSGLIDIRLTLLILAGSLIGVQLGALGTTYVKDFMIKMVMAAVMLIVSVSRGAKIPIYLADLEVIPKLNLTASNVLNFISFWALMAALATAGGIISVAMINGILKDRKKKAELQIKKA